MQNTQTRHIVCSGLGAWAALCCVAAGAAAGCGVSFGGDTYREDVLVRDVILPFGLAVDCTSNELYYSYYNGSWLTAKLDLRTKAVNRIQELSGRCTFAVDQARQQVHARCGYNSAGRGLHHLDSGGNRFVLAGEAGQRVWFVYYKDALYYTLHKAPVTDPPSEVRGLVIDNHADWIFYNQTGVYRRRAGAAGATRYEGFGEYTRALAVDARGAAYACDCCYSTRGVYRLHEHAPGATRLLDVPCIGLTFDRDDNIIYGDFDRDKLVRLVKC